MIEKFINQTAIVHVSIACFTFVRENCFGYNDK